MKYLALVLSALFTLYILTSKTDTDGESSVVSPNKQAINSEKTEGANQVELEAIPSSLTQVSAGTQKVAPENHPLIEKRVPIGQVACIATTKSLTQRESLRKERMRLSGEISRFIKTTMNTDVTEEYVHLLGMTKGSYREYQTLHRPELSTLLPYADDLDSMQHDEYYSFADRLETGDYDGIIDWVESRPSSRNTVFAGETIIGSLLKEDNLLPVDVIDRLAERNVTATLHTLATATRQNASLEQLNALLRYADVDVSNRWHEAYRDCDTRSRHRECRTIQFLGAARLTNRAS